MKILVSGSSGLIGSELITRLKSEGVGFSTLVRRDPKGTEFLWEIGKGFIDVGALQGVDAVIHLAGESVATLRWSNAKKDKILQSRVQGTKLLVQTIKQLPDKPKVFICASAIGIYGSRLPEEVLHEESTPGGGFLAEVVKAWENETAELGRLGVRVVNLRFGLVLSPKGGALKQMLLPFKLGVGGRLGDGKQIMSWIALDDAVSAVIFALRDEKIVGPVNLVSPYPISNSEFTKALAKALRRPAFFPVPGFALKLLLGQVAEEMLLAGANVHPSKLLQSGFHFKYERLEDFLSTLGKESA